MQVDFGLLLLPLLQAVRDELVEEVVDAVRRTVGDRHLPSGPFGSKISDSRGGGASFFRQPTYKPLSHPIFASFLNIF